MNVGELREQLTGIPDERLVIIAGDAEGNRMNRLYEVSPATPYDGEETLHPDDVEELIAERKEAGDDPPVITRVVVLWP